MAEAAALGIESGWVTPVEIDRTFRSLRVPPPANVRQHLVRLASSKLVLRAGTKGGWSLTPLGRQRVTELIGELDYNRIAAEAAHAQGADFAHVRHAVIHPGFAPPRWSTGISRLLERYPFERNVFCMTRFPQSKEDTAFLDPVKDMIPLLREAADNHGLTLHLASDRQIDDDVLGNIGAHMWACQYGIGLVENCAGRGLNYNVVIEVGAMLMTGRRCAILKDQTAPSLPTDLAGQIYKSVNFDDLAAVETAAHGWFSDDLGLGHCTHCTVDGQVA